MTRMRGAAIILAMLIAALAAAVAATVFADQQRWGRTVELRRDQVQAQALAMAGVQWARQILDDDARRSEIDHLGEPWALTLPPIPMEDGEIRGAIVDAQGRLNINALGFAGGIVAGTCAPRSAFRATGRALRCARHARPTGSMRDRRACAMPAPKTRTTSRAARAASRGQRPRCFALPN